MLRIIIGLSIGLLLFTSCEEERMENRPFCPERASTAKLEANGYERVWGVDVVMYERTVGDTTTIYQVEGSYKKDFFGKFYKEKDYCQWWTIKLKATEEKYVREVLAKNDCWVLNYCDEGGFFVKNHSNNVLLNGGVSEKDSTLKLMYHFYIEDEPFDDEEIYIPEGAMELEDDL